MLQFMKGTSRTSTHELEELRLMLSLPTSNYQLTAAVRTWFSHGTRHDRCTPAAFGFAGAIWDLAK